MYPILSQPTQRRPRFHTIQANNFWSGGGGALHYSGRNIKGLPRTLLATSRQFAQPEPYQRVLHPKSSQHSTFRSWRQCLHKNVGTKAAGCHFRPLYTVSACCSTGFLTWHGQHGVLVVPASFSDLAAVDALPSGCTASITAGYICAAPSNPKTPNPEPYPTGILCHPGKPPFSPEEVQKELHADRMCCHRGVKGQPQMTAEGSRFRLKGSGFSGFWC